MTDGIIQESFNHFRAITRMSRYERQYINTLEQEIIEKIKHGLTTDNLLEVSLYEIKKKLIGEYENGL